MDKLNEKVIEHKFIRNKQKFLTPKEFNEQYPIGINRVYELIHVDGFPCIFMGRKALIIAAKVDQWFENNIGKRF